MRSTARNVCDLASLGLLAATAMGSVACFSEDPPRRDPEVEGFRLVMADAPMGPPLAAWRAPEGDVAYVVGGLILNTGPGFIWEVDVDGGNASTAGSAPGALWWIHGVSRTRMWVVGEYGFAGVFTGRSLRELALPTSVSTADTTLYGVWSADGSEVWAVGVEREPGGGERGLLLRSVDDYGFEEVDYGFVARSPFYKVWGSSASDVFVVGDEGNILHFDGSGWALQASGTLDRLGVVHGRGPNQVWAAGGSTEGVLLRWDGSSWQRDESLPRASAPLYGLWVAPEPGIYQDPVTPSETLPRVLYVAGLYGTVLRRYEGDAWIVQDAPETGDVLHSVVGWDTSRALALGGNLLSPGPYSGVVLALGRGLDDGLPVNGMTFYRSGSSPSRSGGGGGGGGFQ